MVSPEQYPPETVITPPDRVHIPRVRTLVQDTHDALMAGEILSPELYQGIFPGHDSMLEGLEMTFETLQSNLAELREPAATTERLVELFRSANLIGQYLSGPYIATSGGAFVLEANRILGSNEQAPPVDMEFDSFVAGSKEATRTMGVEIVHPEGFYQIIESMALAHSRAFDSGHIPPAIIAMRGACSALSNHSLAGEVMSTALDRLKSRLGETAPYYALRNSQPYKNIIFGRQQLELSNEQIARDAITSFRDPELLDEVEDNFKRGTNYKSSLRIVCGAYASLRKAGYGQREAIGALYANGSTFRPLTRSVTDALDFRTTGDTQPPEYLDHLFTKLYERLVPVKEDENNVPQLQFSLQEPFSTAHMPHTMPADITQRLDKKRATTARCPARYSVSGIGGVHTDYISPFSQSISSEHGIDPHIIERDGRIHPTSLIMAMTVRQAERLSLFDVLDERFAQARML